MSIKTFTSKGAVITGTLLIAAAGFAATATPAFAATTNSAAATTQTELTPAVKAELAKAAAQTKAEFGAARSTAGDAPVADYNVAVAPGSTLTVTPTGQGSFTLPVTSGQITTLTTTNQSIMTVDAGGTDIPIGAITSVTPTAITFQDGQTFAGTNNSYAGNVGFTIPNFASLNTHLTGATLTELPWNVVAGHGTVSNSEPSDAVIESGSATQGGTLMFQTVDQPVIIMQTGNTYILTNIAVTPNQLTGTDLLGQQVTLTGSNYTYSGSIPDITSPTGYSQVQGLQLSN